MSVCTGDAGVYFYKDFGRDDSGDVIALTQRVTGKDFKQSVEWLADQLGVPIPTNNHLFSVPKASVRELAPTERRLDALARLYDAAQPLEGTVAADYLIGRGLLDAAIKLGVRCFQPHEPAGLLRPPAELGLGTLTRWVRGGYGFLVYPGWDGRRSVAQRCRLLMDGSEARRLGFQTNHWNPPESQSLGLGTTWPPIPEPVPDEIILTEGETDVLAVMTLVEDALAYAILGSGGLSENGAEFQRIVKHKPKVTLAFQRDEASAKMAGKLLATFKRYGITARAVVPAGGANDWAQLVEWDTERYENLDDLAAPLNDYSVAQLFDALDRRRDDVAAGRVRSIELPWPNLNYAFHDCGIPAETVGLISSVTGGGKTWLSLQLAMYVAGFHSSSGQPVFICNTEMAEATVAARMLAMASSNNKVVTMADADLIGELQFEHQESLDRLPLEVTPPQPRTVVDVIDLLTLKAKDHRLLVVDHIGDIDLGGPSYEVLPKFVLRVRDLARSTGRVIILVTHLKQGEMNGEVLAYSKQMENVVDWSLSLQTFETCNADMSTPTGTIQQEINRTLTVRKNRWGVTGIRIGIMFDSVTLEMKDMGRVKKINKGGNG